MEAPVSAKTALLQALVAGDGYGLELIDRVRERTDDKIKLHQGSVYPALRSLEREGLVESYEGKTMQERGGRTRRYYRITAQGLREAHQNRQAVWGLFEKERLVPA